MKTPRMLNNGRVDTTYTSATRNYTKIDYSERIKYLPNYDYNLVDLELNGDCTFILNTNFSKFGDILRMNLSTSNENTIIFGEGIQSNPMKISKSSFIDFIFDGINFIPTVTSSGISMGDIVNKSTNGGILYTNNEEMSQDSGHFFYNQEKKYLGIGNNRPTAHLTICGSSNSGQMHICNNAPDNESSIGFSKFGEGIEWVLGMFNDTFGVKNLKSGKFYNLAEDKKPGKTIK